MRRLIAAFRAARFALHLGYGLALALIYPWLSAPLRRHILQQWSRSLLHILGVRIQLEDAAPHAPRSGLIVANHISWLDVFVLNAALPMRFVAKSEVRRWPVIGWLCARAQTLFIERGKSRAAARLNAQLVELLRDGERLAVFPEGTTTDGRHVAHFHASPLQPAIDAAVEVHPVALRYLDGNGQFSSAAAYIGDMSFGASLWAILCTPVLHVQLIASTPLPARQLNRRQLAYLAHEHIGNALCAAASRNLHVGLTSAQHAAATLSPLTR